VAASSVCEQAPSSEHLRALASLHRPSDPSIDVLYVSGDDLQRDPTTLSPPHSVAGTFHANGGFEANPVAWRVLATAAVPIRGRVLSDPDVWFDPNVLRRRNLDNLNGYWAARLDSRTGVS